MKVYKSVIILGGIIAVLAAAAAVLGLFFPGSEIVSSPVVSVYGEEVNLYGAGLYRLNTVFLGSTFTGQDIVTLFLGVPFLLITLFLYGKGSLRGGLLLLGILSFFLYAYISMAFGSFYNELFLLYVALFSTSFFAFVLVIRSISPEGLQSGLSEPPRIGPAFFLFVSGAVTIVVWLVPIIQSIFHGVTPKNLDHYTTIITEAFDLAIIVPSTFIVGWMILKRKPLGYLLAFPLLGLIVMLLPAIVAGTFMQLRSGLLFTPGEIIGPIAGFGLLGIASIVVIIAILRRVAKR
jgi:hypothetical protein